MRVAPGVRALWLSVAGETIDSPPIHQVHNCSSCTRRGENLIVELGIYQTKRHPVSGCLVEVDVVVDPADFRRGRDAVAI